MNLTCDELLASAAFAHDQHRGVRLCDTPYFLEEFLHPEALPRDGSQAVFVAVRGSLLEFPDGRHAHNIRLP